MNPLRADSPCLRPFVLSGAEAPACTTRESALAIGRRKSWCREGFSVGEGIGMLTYHLQTFRKCTRTKAVASRPQQVMV